MKRPLPLRIVGGTDTGSLKFAPLWSRAEAFAYADAVLAPDHHSAAAQRIAALTLTRSSAQLLHGFSDASLVQSACTDLLAGHEVLEARIAQLNEAHRRLLLCQQYNARRRPPPR